MSVRSPRLMTPGSLSYPAAPHFVILLTYTGQTRVYRYVGSAILRCMRWRRLLKFCRSVAESSELFEVGEGAFDTVSLAIQRSIEASLHLAQAARREDGSNAAFSQRIQDGVGVLAFVGEHRFRLQVAQQCQRPGAVVSLAAGQHKGERQAEFVGHQVNYGRQTTAAPLQNCLRRPFFRAEAAC
jgi:hypothetical protein